MKKFDESRRNTIKGMAAFSALAMFGNTLNAEETNKTQTLVLLNDSKFSTEFERGVNKVESNNNHIKKVNLIGDYASFENLLKEYISNNNIKKITGLLTQADFVLLNEKIKGTGITLKAEIAHTISEKGTEHNFCVTNCSSSVISNAKSVLEINQNWANLTGFILGGASSSKVLSRLNKNGFKETTITKNLKGDTKLVSFLATIDKEIKNV